MSGTDEVEGLRQQLAERDKVISSFKDKTKSFVQKMKDDSNRELAAKDREIAVLKDREANLTQRIGELERFSIRAKEEADAEIMRAVGATETLANENAKFQAQCEDLRGQLSSLMQKEASMSPLESSLSPASPEVLTLESQVQELQRELEDRKNEINKSQGLYQELHQNKDVVEKQVSLLQKEKDVLTLELKNAEGRLAKQLAEEEERMTEMKKKTKTFVENLASEKESVASAARATEMKVELIEKERREASAQLAIVSQKLHEYEGNMGALQEQHNRHTAEHEEVVQGLKKEIAHHKSVAMEEGRKAQAILAQRESEIGSNHKEVEDHKSKRIAARNEMIQLAGTLETMHEEVAKLKHTIQFVLSPMVTEQIKGIEISLRALEVAIGQIMSKKTPRSTFDKSPTMHEQAFASDSPSSTSSLSVAGAKPLHTVKDALVQAELLRNELAKSQSGITLLSHAIQRLDTISRAENRGDCCNLFGLLRGEGAGGGSTSKPSSSSSSPQDGSLGTSTGARVRMADRLRTGATSKGYNRLANSSHNDTDAIEMPNTPGGRFTIEDE